MQILLFGKLADALGRELTAEVPPQGCSVGDLRASLLQRGPGYEELGRPTVKACVDQVMVQDEHHLTGNEEVAFFPPVSGG